MTEGKNLRLVVVGSFILQHFYSKLKIPNSRKNHNESVVYAHLNIKHFGNKWRLVDLKCLTQHDNFFVRSGNYYNSLHTNWNVSCKVIKRWLKRFWTFRTKKSIFLEQIFSDKISKMRIASFSFIFTWVLFDKSCFFTSDTPSGWVFLFQTKNIHCFYPFQRSFFLCMRFSNSHFSTKMSSQSTVWRSSLLKWASSRVWRCACVGNLFLFLFLMSMRQTQTKQQNTTSWT